MTIIILRGFNAEVVVMITSNACPMLAEEIFKINFYCSEAEAIEFNNMILDIDIRSNYARIKEYVDRVLKN